MRDSALVRELMQGVDIVFHLAAIRITQCAEEPRLALEVLVDGTYNVVEAAAEAKVRKVVASSTASVYGLAEEFPTTRAPAPVRQRHALRRGEGLQRGPAALVPRDEGPRLRRAALLQRLRPADGRARPLHRGARALDGAHHRGQAAADPRRRPADDGLHLHGGHRPREHARGRERADRQGLQRRQRRRDEPARAGADAAARDGLRARRRARPGARRQRRHPPPRRHEPRARGARLRGRGRPRGGPDPPRRLVARRARRRAGRADPPRWRGAA